MKYENQDKDKHKNSEEDSLTLAKIVCTWYVGASVGFAIGYLKGNNLSAAVIGMVIGAAVSRIFKQCFMSKE